MLSIFSCACWPSVYLLWRNVYLGLLPTFWLGCLFFWYWAVWAICIFWKLSPCWSYCLQVFSPILWLSFCFGFVYGFVLFMVSFSVQKPIINSTSWRGSGVYLQGGQELVVATFADYPPKCPIVCSYPPKLSVLKKLCQILWCKYRLTLFCKKGN